MLHDDAPSVRYYRRYHGRWAGAFRLAITDWGAFRRARLSLAERFSVLALAWLPRRIAPIRMSTSVDADRAVSAGEVVHLTAIRIWGVLIHRSREVFRLHDDGRRVAITRVQRYWPLLGRPLPADEASAVIDPDGAQATYDWVWYDRRLDQRTTPLEDDLRIDQRSDWSSAEVVLRRASDAPAAGDVA